ncbi:MAG TPA: hypothetical protein VE975_05775 [Actinomycetota bacterium]|jgi:hypothetical protein|nr:hypothetical protein [Actinomycetota bacterium]
MEPNEVVWEGRVGETPLRVGVPHAGRIIAEWDTPQGSRFKVADSLEEFERSVLFQLLLSAGESGGTAATEDVTAAIIRAQEERPAPRTESTPRRRSKGGKARQHRRSRRPPRRR